MMPFLRNSFDERWGGKKYKNVVGFFLIQFESFVLAGVRVHLGKIRLGKEIGLCGLGINN